MTNLTEHKLITGDALDILIKMKNESINLIITSPPYWNAKDYCHSNQIGYKESLEEYLIKMKSIISNLSRILAKDGKFALNIGNIFNYELIEKRVYTANLILDLWDIIYRENNLRYMGTIYWKKTTSRNGAVLFGSYPYPTNFLISTALEAVHIFRKIGSRKISPNIKILSKISKKQFKLIRDPIWELNGVKTKNHPAVFPNSLANRLIKIYSFYKDIVLDPFCGTGTTNEESLKLGRNSIGIDINPKYVNIAFNRLQDYPNSIIHYYK